MTFPCRLYTNLTHGIVERLRHGKNGSVEAVWPFTAGTFTRDAKKKERKKLSPIPLRLVASKNERNNKHFKLQEKNKHLDSESETTFLGFEPPVAQISLRGTRAFFSFLYSCIRFFVCLFVWHGTIRNMP